MGAEFIAEEGILQGLILSLDKGEEWTIGRDPDLCTIVLEDPKISRLHLRINKTPEGYIVENFSENNPVLIGGEPFSVPTLLHDEDLVTIGGSVFRFYPKGAPGMYGFTTEGFPESEEDEEFTEESTHPEEEKQPEQEESLFEEPESEEEEKEEVEKPLEEEPASDQDMSEEEFFTEPLFEEADVPELKIDLTQTTRFILKVIAGPNTGAEFALDLDRSYLVGTDTASCDIVFNDLSVSREHARLSIDADGKIAIQDLGSRNGVIVDKERIIGSKTLSANAVVALGTSAFLLIDREAPSETIAAPLFEAPAEEEEETKASEEEVEEVPAAVKAPPKAPLPAGTLVIALIICGLAVLFGVGMVSLFQTQDIEVVSKDYLTDLQAIIKEYPAVRYTFNPATGKLFLMGHVKTGIDHNELMYQLKGLGFITGIEDNVVNDEAVWQEMNILLSKHSDFKGVSMHSPEAGVFVISGYLQTEQQASNLSDYLNVNFNYLTRLQNRVVVEQSVLEEVASQLIQQGFSAVHPTLSNGDLQLTGYVNSTENFAFEKLVDEFKKIPGVRTVRNFVVTVTPEQGVVDLNQRYLNIPNLNAPVIPGMTIPSMPAMLNGGRQPHRPRYRVTGYSKHGDVNINVVINGQIVGRGDCIDGFTITSIQPHIIFLEKDGLKYKIEYNTCKYFDMEE